eukprot:TRINITY_DN791_c0_g1_i1.p1 TRINITY_DN791_c0_g1~~TRINITY_DN791_c0_g1_i1.p1  ORF type:complete len:719 (+),score=245.36 TRINITY_DN791_c0_g1_i1:43-2199(+)
MKYSYSIVVMMMVMMGLCAAQSQLSYTVGQNYEYQVNGVVLNNGVDSVTSAPTPGYHSVLTSTLVMQPVQEDENTYLFVMNMWNTVVSIDESEATPIGSSSSSLGYDVYFNQSKSGPINEIIYETDDSPYYLNVKIGAINALQTAVVSAGNMITITENDPIGIHTATVVGSMQSSLSLSKTFTQVDFSQFPDPTLNPSNIALAATGQVTVHPDGYVLSAELNQSIILTNISPSSASASASTAGVADMNNATGLNMLLAAGGQLTLTYSPSTSSSSFTFQQAVAPKKATMFEIAVMTQTQTLARAHTHDDISSLIDSSFSFEGETVKVISKLNRIASHIQANPDSADILLSPYTQQMDDETTRDRLFYIIAAAKNLPLLLKHGLFSDDCSTLSRALLASFSFDLHPSSSSESSSMNELFVSRLAELSSDLTCGPQIANIALHASSNLEQFPRIKNNDFPYNKSYEKDVHLGGKLLAADFDVSVFAGTNFNCNQTYFNYEASASSSVTATLFGYSQQAVAASIVYGKDNGQTLSDEITLSVWGKQVYDLQIPSLDCQSHTYPIGGVSPGFTISHIVWVSVIPVVFSATASLDLQAEWGWSVCDATLSADIYVSPQATIAVDTYTYTDLILLRAGFELQGSLNTVITPELYIHGTQCQIGFDVTEQNQPMDISFESFYQWKHCKVIIFDCVWGTRDNQTWWSWSLPSNDVVLFDETFQIAH